LKAHNETLTHFRTTVMRLALWNLQFKRILFGVHKIKSRKYRKYQNLIRKIVNSNIVGRLILFFVQSPGAVRFQEYFYVFETVQPNKFLLEIGSGFSCFPSFVARYKGIDVISLDINKDAIRESHEASKKMHGHVSSRMHFIIAGAQNLPFRDASIPQICSVSVLEHIQNDRSSSAEIGRVFSHQGLCCITLRYSCIPRRPHYLSDGTYERFYTESEIKTRIVAESRLDLKHSRLIDKRFTFIIFKLLRFVNPQENLILALLARKLDVMFLKTSKDAGGIVLTIK